MPSVAGTHTGIVYPGAVFNAIVYSGATGIGLRIRGIALCAAWLLLLWIWAGRHPQTLVPRRRFQALILSFNMLGVLPFVLVLARSEQLLVLGLVAYCMLALFWPAKASDGLPMKSLKGAALFLMGSVFLLTHPKALFFAPLMVASTWLVFRNAGRQWVAGAMLVTGFAIFQSFQYAQLTASCPGAPRWRRCSRSTHWTFVCLRVTSLLFCWRLCATWRPRSDW